MDLKLVCLLISLPALAYLFGSIPMGLILTRVFTPIDVRAQGSGNIGATNVRRLAGNRLGVATLLGDLAKGALPVYGAVAVLGTGAPLRDAFVGAVALSAFAGHLFPLYLRCKKGGKGVATAAGCFGVISPAATLVAVLVFIMMICWSNRVSVGSLAAVVVLPLAVWQATHSAGLVLTAGIMAVAVWLRHRDNLARLLAGTESVIWKK